MARERFDFIVRLRDSYSRGMAKLRDRSNRFLKTLLKISGISAGISAALGAISGIRAFGSAISSAAEFEEQLSKVRGVSGATAEDFARLKAAAEEAGATTRFTATEAAQGLEELARAGQSADEAIATLPNALRLAQANTIELAQAAQLTTTTLNQFGLAATDSRRVADVLTRATQTSAQNIEELGNALEGAGPQARLMGISLEQTSALIGKLADQGFRGEKGGIALRNALIELQNPASAFNQELRALGITSTDFVEVLDQLESSGARSETALLALGKRAGPAITALVQGGTSGLRDLITELEKAEGTAQRTAEEMDSNLRGSVKNLESAFDAFRRAVVQPLLAPMAREVRGLAERFREFAASDALPKLQKALVALFTRATDAIKGFLGNLSFEDIAGNISRFVNRTAEKFQKFAANALAVAGAVGKAFQGLSAVFKSVRTGITGLVNVFFRAALIFKEQGLSILEQTNANVRVIAKARAEVEALRDTIADLDRQTVESARETRQAWGEFLGIIEKTPPAMQTVKEETDAVEQEFGMLLPLLPEMRDKLIPVIQAWDDLKKAQAEAKNEAADTSTVIGNVADKASTLASRIAEFGRSIDERLRGEAATALKEFDATLGNSSSTVDEIKSKFLEYADAAIKSNDGVADSAIRAQAAQLGLGDEVDALVDKYKQLKANVDEAIKSVGEGAEEGAEAVSRLGEYVETDASGTAAVIAGILDSWRQLGAGIAREVDAIVKGVSTQGISVQKFFRDLGRELQSLSERYEQQSEKAQDILDRIAASGGETRRFAGELSSAVSSLELLDDQTLSQLKAALASARGEAESVRRSVEGLLQSIQDRIDALTLSAEEQELRRLIRERQEIEQQIADARRNGTAAELQLLREALKLQDELIDKTKQRFQEEAAARAQSENAAESDHQRALDRVDELASKRIEADKRVQRGAVRNREELERLDDEGAARLLDKAFNSEGFARQLVKKVRIIQGRSAGNI